MTLKRDLFTMVPIVFLATNISVPELCMKQDLTFESPGSLLQTSRLHNTLPCIACS